jgi:DNA-binding transcriptional LysR family regulator
MLRPTSLLRQLCEDLCDSAGFRPTLGFEGDDLPTVRGFVGVGLGVAMVPALREGSPDAVGGPLRYLKIADNLAVRGIRLTWSTERRLLPAAELFREHAIARATAQLLPAVTRGG